MDGVTRSYTRQQLMQLAQVAEQDIRNKSEPEEPKEPDPDENTVEKRLERAEVQLAKQAQEKANEDHRSKVLNALSELNEPHQLPPKARKIVDLQTVAMMNTSKSDIGVEHGKAVVAIKEALVEYGEQQKEKVNAETKAKIFSTAGVGQRSRGGVPEMEPVKPHGIDHVKSGAAYENMAALIEEIRNKEA